MDPSDVPDTAGDEEQPTPPSRQETARRCCKALAMGLDAISAFCSLTGRDSLAAITRLSALPLRAIADKKPSSPQ